MGWILLVIGAAWCICSAPSNSSQHSRIRAERPYPCGQRVRSLPRSLASVAEMGSRSAITCIVDWAHGFVGCDSCRQPAAIDIPAAGDGSARRSSMYVLKCRPRDAAYGYTLFLLGDPTERRASSAEPGSTQGRSLQRGSRGMRVDTRPTGTSRTSVRKGVWPVPAAE